MDAIGENLRRDLAQPEFSEGYAESFQDTYIATQLKVLREQNGWTQATLAEKLGTTQTVISRIENVNYSAWNISTLKKLARAFRVRLKVSFETYGSLIHDVEDFNRKNLQRTPREVDPVLTASAESLPLDESIELIAVGNEMTLPERTNPERMAAASERESSISMGAGKMENVMRSLTRGLSNSVQLEPSLLGSTSENSIVSGQEGLASEQARKSPMSARAA